MSKVINVLATMANDASLVSEKDNQELSDDKVTKIFLTNVVNA